MANEDRAYLIWVKSTQRCLMAWNCVCTGGFADAHHAGERGLGQKAHDHTVIPLCRRHHSEWHDCRGIFAGWTKDERRDFAIRAIGRLRALYAAWQAADANGESLI